MKHKRARTSPAGEKHLDRKLRLGIDMVDLVSHLFKED